MSEFIGRKKELDFLTGAYNSPIGSFVPIYGRRRVGKTALIREFVKDKPAIFFTGKQASEKLQLHHFLQITAQTLDEPFIANLTFQDWHQALDLIRQKWKGPEKLIIVLDEFQWTVDASPQLPSYIQEFWDSYWQNSGQVMLILCGSYIGFMEKKVLGAKSPLFGRRTGQIFLKPFGFRDAALFHPGLSHTDLAKIYIICGGIPYYLLCFSGKDSVTTNVEKVFLNEFSPLCREVDFLLREELREVETYYTLLFTLGTRRLSGTELAREAGIPERSIFYYLNNLSELGYISKHHPIHHRTKRRTNAKYLLADSFLLFWFTFVYPNMNLLINSGPKAVFNDKIKSFLPSYFGLGFEKMCREALPFLYRKEGVTAAFETGEYWDKTTQIDLVGIREDGRADIGECKWGTIRSLKQLVSELESKVSKYPNPRNYTIQRRIFSRLKLPKGSLPDGYLTHTLDALYD